MGAISYVTSPVATDAFSRVMLESYAEKSLYAAGFMTLFAMSRPPRFFIHNDTTDIQIMRSGNRMAPMVVRGVPTPIGSNRRTVQDDGWTDISRVFPMIEKPGSISSDQLTKRVFSEAMYDGFSKQQRAVVIAGRKFTNMEADAAMTCEYLASMSITDGKQVSLLEQTGDEIEYDFLRDAEGKKTYAADWASSDTDIDVDLDAACDFVQMRGKTRAAICIAGDNKFREWQATDKFAKVADWRNVVNIKAGFDEAVSADIDRLVNAGFDFQFVWKTSKGRKLFVLTYDHTYTPVVGSDEERFMDADAVIVMPLPRDIRLDACWGPSDHFDFTDEKAILYADVFGINVEDMGRTNAHFPEGFAMPGLYYDAYKADSGGKGIALRLQCAPIFATVQTDGICTIKESW